MVKFMSRALFIHRMAVPLLAAGLFSCTSPSVPSWTTYRLEWTATRTADHTVLFSTSMRLPLGSDAAINTDSTRPTEDRPALPRFSARLSRTKSPGVLQLVTRAEVREETRTKKGKMKITKRNIGALLPIRAGETQEASLPTDLIHLEVRLERD